MISGDWSSGDVKEDIFRWQFLFSWTSSCTLVDGLGVILSREQRHLPHVVLGFWT